MLNAKWVINSLRQNTGLVTVLKLNARMAILLKLNAKMIILWFTVQRTSRPQPRYLLLLRRQPQLSLEGISSIALKIHIFNLDAEHFKLLRERRSRHLIEFNEMVEQIAWRFTSNFCFKHLCFDTFLKYLKRASKSQKTGSTPK